MVLVPLTAQLFDENGTRTARLTADQGELNTLTQEMSATGNVVLVSPDETRRLQTEYLRYDPDAERIWSDTTTTMEDEGVRLTGSGFESDADFLQVELFESRGESVDSGAGSPVPEAEGA